MTLSIGEWMAFMMRDRVAFRSFDGVALSARLSIWHIDTFLAWNRLTLLKRNFGTDLLWNSVALDPVTDLVTLLFIDCGTNGFFISLT